MDFIKEDPVGVVFLLFIFGLLYIYKTRGFTKRGFYSKPSNLYFWFQVGLLVLLVICQPQVFGIPTFCNRCSSILTEPGTLTEGRVHGGEQQADVWLSPLTEGLENVVCTFRQAAAGAKSHSEQPPVASQRLL